MQYLAILSNPFWDELKFVFIEKDRWLLLLRGLFATLVITLSAAVIGMVLGFVIAMIRAAHDSAPVMKPLPRLILGAVNWLAKAYITVIRGTPVVVQLLIIYFVIFASVNINPILVSVISFGLNSSAYVAEIVRSGIMSIDRGQMEAGRSLGLSFVETMTRIILPQALKNVLPALVNETIALLKETSVSGYIAVNDLTKGGDTIRSVTYSAFLPLIAVALIYLSVVMVMSRLVSLLERRLRASDH